MVKNYISLGGYCGVASSMAKYGLRSFSGPFDWLDTEFKNVLRCIEKDFDGFLKKDSLIEDKKVKMFTDKLYNFKFWHEISLGLCEEYDMIYDKYMRRIKRFREEIKRKTLFIRIIKDYDDLNFITKNESKIKKIIKRFNKENDIIYILSEKIFDKRLNYDNFFWVEDYYQGYGVGNVFDNNKNLLNFLLSNISEDVRMKNLEFDKNRNRNRNTLLKRIDKLSIFEVDKNIGIYGGGDIGKAIYNKIEPKSKIKCFIDRLGSKVTYKDIPGILIDDIANYKLDKIIICIPLESECIWVADLLKKVLDNKIEILTVYDILKGSEMKKCTTNKK